MIKPHQRVEAEILEAARGNANSHYAALRERSVLKPQQPEGELIVVGQYIPKEYIPQWEINLCTRIAKAQLAHDKATMVKLPSEDELAMVVHDWHCPDEIGIDEVYWTGPRKQAYLECAQELLKLLQGQGEQKP